MSVISKIKFQKFRLGFMITILHGDNQVASRARLVKLKEEAETENFYVVIVDGKQSSFAAINISAQTTSLLGQRSALFVEDFFSRKRVKSKKQKDLLEGNSVIFWESVELPKSILDSFPKGWKIEHFPIPKTIFRLLDCLVPGNAKNILQLIYRAKGQEPEQLVLAMISWHVRYLLWAKEQPKTLDVPLWKRRRLITQANMFTKEKLYALHKQLFDLDRKQKTGVNFVPLWSGLDFIAASL